MGKRTWKHRLSNKNYIEKSAFCAECDQVVEIREVGSKKIWKCLNSRRTLSKGRPYRLPFFSNEIKKCVKCEVMNSDFRFFDVHHIDGDHDNNHLSNLELLCPNCHRIETIKQYAENRMLKFNRSIKRVN